MSPLQGVSWLCFVFCFFSSAMLQADGGRVQGEKNAGGYRIALFANPSPLRSGLAEFSVFIQQEGKSGPVLDAEVTIRLNKISRPSPELAWRGPGCVSPGQGVQAIQGHSGNGLLYSALLGIPEPGLWDVGVSISRMGVVTPVSFDLQVERMESPVIKWWPLVGIVPAAVCLYALRGWLLKKRRST